MKIMAALAFFAADCNHVDLATILNQFEGKGRLHNCEIELVTRTSYSGVKQYMLLANDLPFEFQIDQSCLNEVSIESLKAKTIHYSYGFTTQNKDYKVAINIQMGYGRIPTSLIIQYIDLLSHKVEQRVSCKLNLEEL